MQTGSPVGIHYICHRLIRSLVSDSRPKVHLLDKERNRHPLGFLQVAALVSASQLDSTGHCPRLRRGCRVAASSWVWKEGSGKLTGFSGRRRRHLVAGRPSSRLIRYIRSFIHSRGFSFHVDSIHHRLKKFFGLGVVRSFKADCTAFIRSSSLRPVKV